MTKLDTQSWIEHDEQYKSTSNLEYSLKKNREYESVDMFGKNGYKEVIDQLKDIDTHIDIGSGTGWLMAKTSPYFKRVIGIEPSHKAVEISKKLNNQLLNLEYLNEEMISGIKSLNITKPVFLTTGIVLSHIKDFHIKELLKLLNTIPEKSVLYFYEPYGTNIQQNMWHVRSKEWWAKNLSSWNVVFKEVHDGGTKSGIYAIKLSDVAAKNDYTMSAYGKICWFCEGVFNKIKRVWRHILRLLKIK
jgi:hypothetical protein